MTVTIKYKGPQKGEQVNRWSVCVCALFHLEKEEEEEEELSSLCTIWHFPPEFDVFHHSTCCFTDYMSSVLICDVKEKPEREGASARFQPISPLFQFVEGSFEKYLERLEDPKVSRCDL